MKSDIANQLRDQGYRITPQRLMMLEVLAKHPDHLSAEDIHARILNRYPYVNLSTVYRTLEMLVSEGIVREAELGGGRRFFEMASGADPHHHLVCRTCGGVQHIAARHLDPVERHLLKEHRFEVSETVLTSFGKCGKCRRKPSA
jgi:Fur family ferric uptake transcriptional regulator